MEDATGEKAEKEAEETSGASHLKWSTDIYISRDRKAVSVLTEVSRPICGSLKIYVPNSGNVPSALGKGPN